MPVASVDTYKAYIGHAGIRNYVFPYYVVKLSDIVVMNIRSEGFTQYTLGDEYNINTAMDPVSHIWPTGVTVSFEDGQEPASGTILIMRKTSLDQLAEFTNGVPFTAETMNNIVDKLTVQIQDATPGFKGTFLEFPSVGEYVAGDWIKLYNPQEGGSFGMVCVEGGTPGTWVNFGAITSSIPIQIDGTIGLPGLLRLPLFGVTERLIIQWGIDAQSGMAPTTSIGRTMNWPVAFPNAVFVAFCSPDNSADQFRVHWYAAATTKAHGGFGINAVTDPITAYSFSWLAIGY